MSSVAKSASREDLSFDTQITTRCPLSPVILIVQNARVGALTAYSGEYYVKLTTSWGVTDNEQKQSAHVRGNLILHVYMDKPFTTIAAATR